MTTLSDTQSSESFFYAFLTKYNTPFITCIDDIKKDAFMNTLLGRFKNLSLHNKSQKDTTDLKAQITEITRSIISHKQEFGKKQQTLQERFEEKRKKNLQELIEKLMQKEAESQKISTQKEETTLEKAFKISLSKEFDALTENDCAEFIKDLNTELKKPLVQTRLEGLPHLNKLYLPIFISKALSELKRKKESDQPEIESIIKDIATLKAEITALEKQSFAYAPHQEAAQEHIDRLIQLQERAKDQEKMSIYEKYKDREKDIICNLQETHAHLIFLKQNIKTNFSKKTTFDEKEALKIEIAGTKEYIKIASLYLDRLKKLFEHAKTELKVSLDIVEICNLFTEDIKKDLQERKSLMQLIEKNIASWKEYIETRQESLTAKNDLLKALN